MSGPNNMSVRAPAVAGRFYPADAMVCRTEAQAYLHAPGNAAQTEHWLGGIVPHAGWVCSGAVAGQTMAAIAATTPADVVVVFGAIHTPIPFDRAALDANARWWAPFGESQLPQGLQAKLVEASSLFVVEPRLHVHEHAIEVEVPLIQLAWPGATVLPIEVASTAEACAIGQQTAHHIAQANLRAVYLASSDLTHYGPAYRFTPAGVGRRSLAWAMDNDRRLLRLVTSMSIDQIVPEAMSRQNACGAGAIAAMLSACREMGATGATVLRHTNSFETLAHVQPQTADNAVGYAAVVVR